MISGELSSNNSLGEQAMAISSTSDKTEDTSFQSFSTPGHSQYICIKVPKAHWLHRSHRVEVKDFHSIKFSRCKVHPVYEIEVYQLMIGILR